VTNEVVISKLEIADYMMSAANQLHVK